MVFAILTSSGSFAGEPIAENQQDLIVEGILEDRNNPAESTAIVNNELLQVGGRILDYEVSEIRTETVSFRNTTTGESLKLSPAAKPAQPDTAPQSAPTPSGTFADWFEKFIKGFSNSGKYPAQKLNPDEDQGAEDLRMIYNAGALYYLKYKQPPREIKELVQPGLLTEDFKEGTRGKYRFKIDNEARGINADPVSQETGLRHLFIDKNYVVHAEENQPATANSSLYVKL